jgi:hypothetical protein
MYYYYYCKSQNSLFSLGIYLFIYFLGRFRYITYTYGSESSVLDLSSGLINHWANLDVKTKNNRFIISLNVFMSRKISERMVTTT